MTNQINMLELRGASITKTGMDGDGRKLANITLNDGREGFLDYEFVRKFAVDAGKESRKLLEGLGYERNGGCVAGLFSSTHYTHPSGASADVEARLMGRIDWHGTLGFGDSELSLDEAKSIVASNIGEPWCEELDHFDVFALAINSIQKEAN